MFDFDDASRKSKEAMDAMLKGYADIAKGYQSIADEATEFSRRAYRDMASYMESLTAARSLEEVYQLQTGYMKSSYEAFIAEATKMSDLYTSLARSTYRPGEAASPMSTSTAVVAAEAA